MLIFIQTNEGICKETNKVFFSHTAEPLNALQKKM